MSIYEVLIEHIISFERHTGLRPKAIYLGREEILLLKSYVNYVNYNYKQISRMSNNLNFNGIIVYEVKEENHMGIN